MDMYVVPMKQYCTVLSDDEVQCSIVVRHEGRWEVNLSIPGVILLVTLTKIEARKNYKKYLITNRRQLTNALYE